MRKLIAASILSADFSRLGEELKAAESAGADWVHFDVMDGRFVPNISFGIPVLESIRPVSRLTFDVHLMIAEPQKYVAQFRKAGADYITVHAEACEDLVACLRGIRRLGAKAGVSLNPKTPVEKALQAIPDADLILFMGVEPGFGGQKFDETVIPKIKAARKAVDAGKHRALIEVDGGVNDETAEAISKAGADVFVAGSYLFKNKQGLKHAIAELRKRI